MENDIVIIKPEEFGIKEVEANELTIGLSVTLKEREPLIAEFDKVSILSFADSNSKIFKTLRLKIVKNRTKGINGWHKKSKDYFLKGGQFVDAIKRKEIAINEQMESKLLEGEKYYENLEKNRLAELQAKRVNELSEFVEDAYERNLSDMEQDVWDAYIASKKKAFKDQKEAEKKAELERIAAEKLEAKRIADIEKQNKKLAAEKKKAEKERLRLAEIQAAKDKKAEEERQRLAKIAAEKLAAEKKKAERLVNELKTKRAAEIKAAQKKEADLQVELNKGDSAKLKDLLADLIDFKTKYSFKSVKNNKTYADINILIDEAIILVRK